MSERDGKKPSERPDYFRDFPEEFEQHPDAPARDLARRARKEADRAAAGTHSGIPRSEPQASGEIHEDIVPRSEPPASGEIHEDSALARIEAMKQRVRELEKK